MSRFRFLSEVSWSSNWSWAKLGYWGTISKGGRSVRSYGSSISNRSNWASKSYSFSYWSHGGNGSLDDSWGLTVNDSVKSVDWVSGVGDGTDGTIRLNKRVLSSYNTTVTSLVGRLLVSGEGIRDGVSVVVLWVWVIWLWGNSDGLGNGRSGIAHWTSESLGNWSTVSGITKGWSYSSSISNWCWSHGSSISQWSSRGSGSHSGKSQNTDELVHFGAFWRC
jgi:hypothetical protein